MIATGWAQLAMGLRPLRGLGDRIAARRTGEASRMGVGWQRSDHGAEVDVARGVGDRPGGDVGALP